MLSNVACLRTPHVLVPTLVWRRRVPPLPFSHPAACWRRYLGELRGSPDDELNGRLYLHYDFPPYSTNETGKVSGGTDGVTRWYDGS